MHLSLRDIVDRLDESVTVYDHDARLVFISAAAARLFGRPSEELLGVRPWELVPPGPRTPFRDALEAVLAGGGKQSVLTYVAQFGRRFEVDIYPHPEGALAVSRDVTERRRADEVLRQSEARFRAMVEHAPEAIIIYDVDSGAFVAANAAAEKLFGLSRAALLRMGPLDLSPEQQADGTRSGDLIAKYVGQVVGEGSASFELTMLDASGKVFPAEVSAQLLPSAHPTLLRASVVDVSARNRARERLALVQRIEAVGRLAGGVAHDFNNLLTIIFSYASLALREVGPGERVRSFLGEIGRAAERSTELTRQLLALSRQQVLQPEVLDLDTVVANSAKMLQSFLREDIEIVRPASRAAGRVRADPREIERVILNLAVNARDAMPRGGRLTLETGDVELADGDVEGVPPGRYVTLSVSDTGVGMDAATREQIFEPFFTTKGIENGTGLGLASVSGIVQQSGGHIRVESELGRGSVFRIYLPRTDAELGPRPARPPPPTKLQGTETILLVEDDDQLRAAFQEVLAQSGYHVLGAQNAGEAFLIGLERTAPIHLLVTDVVMPRMDGDQLAERLSSARPEMKVLYVSGYPRTARMAPGAPYIQKPLTPEALLRGVRQALDGATPAARTSTRLLRVAPERPPGARVLIVDDDLMVRTIAASLLRAQGCLCDTVERGDEIGAALARAETSGVAVDLILMDLNMEDGRGDEVLRRLRADGAAVPVVCMSGDLLSDELAARYGFDGALQKPFSGKELASCVVRHARRAGSGTTPSPNG